MVRDDETPGQLAGRMRIVGRAWREVLDKASFESDLPFGEAGGDSLRLLKLVFLLEEESGLRLPMDACHAGLRPSGFAAVLELAERPGESAGVALPGTVFLIPGMGGELQLEGGFVAGCKPALHVAVVDLPDWPDMLAPDFRMEDLVEHAVAAIIARAPDGPVRLAGYSLGGHIAFDVARALVARGRSIGFVGILDTNTRWKPRPIAQRPAPIRALRHFQWEIYNLARATRHGAAADKLGELTAQFLSRPGRPGRLRMATRWRRTKLPSSYAMYIDIYLREILQSRVVRAGQAERSFPAPPLHAPVVLFRSEGHAASEAADLGWRALCPDLRIVHVAGGHRTMLRAPHLAPLCDQFIRAADVAADVRARQFVA